MPRKLKVEELRSLLAEGLNLSDDLKTDRALEFQAGYQNWYTRALTIIRELIPDRLPEFERLYQRDASQELRPETYSVSDFLIGLIIIQRDKAFDGKGVARSRILQQIGILGSARTLLEEHEGVMPGVDESGKARRVFVVHGRDERLRKGMFDFLRGIGLDPIEWSKATALTGKASPYIGEVLQAAFKHAQAVVVLLTPDDEARLRRHLIKEDDPDYEKHLTGQARPNVLFEAGMAFAIHSDKTVITRIGEIRPFSDVAGRHAVEMDGSFLKRHELALRLKTAGCCVDLDGTHWHSAGDLTPPLTQPDAVGPASARVRHEIGDASSPKSRLHPLMPVTIVPVSRGTARGEFFLKEMDDLGVVIELTSGDHVRIPRADFIESWDDARQRPKLELTRKYFQGYFPGYESAEEFFLPR